MGGRLQGTCTIVTGAARGLGAALARRFAQEGVQHLMIVDADAQGLQAVRDSLDPSPDVVHQAALDVADEEALDEAVTQAASAAGRLDIMVNNVGVLNKNAKFHNLSADEFRRVLDINVIGVANGMRAALRHMRPAGKGAIVNTASISAFTSWPYASAYCASKAAVVQLTRVAAVEYAAEGVRINCVCPGTFRSAIHDSLPESAIATMERRYPIGRLGRPEDIVEAFIYLASEASPWTTGTALTVDGGCSAW